MSQPVGTPQYCRMDEARRPLQTILLVDDDPVVRTVARRLLKRSDYVVLEASSGDEALSLLRARPIPVDLLLTDIVMPGLSGWELCELVRDEFPAIPILFMSAFPGDEVTGTRARASEQNFLIKPFDFEALTRAVENLLGPAPDTR
jgi:CheY-like chemotaxis protein